MLWDVHLVYCWPQCRFLHQLFFPVRQLPITTSTIVSFPSTPILTRRLPVGKQCSYALSLPFFFRNAQSLLFLLAIVITLFCLLSDVGSVSHVDPETVNARTRSSPKQKAAAEKEKMNDNFQVGVVSENEHAAMGETEVSGVAGWGRKRALSPSLS